jgi:hypothetical protein
MQVNRHFSITKWSHRINGNNHLSMWNRSTMRPDPGAILHFTPFGTYILPRHSTVRWRCAYLVHVLPHGVIRAIYNCKRRHLRYVRSGSGMRFTYILRRHSPDADLTCMLLACNYSPRFFWIPFAQVAYGNWTATIASCAVSDIRTYFSSVVCLMQVFHKLEIFAIFLLQTIVK